MKAFITGGAGFIGTNLAVKLAAKNWKVTVFDNLSRRGTKNNLEFLKKTIPKNKLSVIIGDIRDSQIAKHLNTDAVFHLAGQTAVTTSVTDPRNDFDVNAFGTFNLLEAVRLKNKKAVFVYASTNKVYGSLDWMKKYPKKGIGEEIPLDFHSPYGVSKGAADSYTKDYARIYGMNTVVFRQSCIYGTHQLGIEDQGWVAHLGARAIFNKSINIYGNGKQIRDLLYVDDLTELYLTAVKNAAKIKGEVFNIGGGTANAISVNEYLSFLSKTLGRKLKLKNKKTRPGDQLYFVADNSKAKKILAWAPRVSYKKGLPEMLKWISENKQLFESL